MLEGTGIQQLRFNNREGGLPGLTHDGEEYTVDAAYNLNADEPMLICSGNNVVRRHIPATDVNANDLNELGTSIGSWLLQTREVRALCNTLRSSVGEILPYSSLTAQLDRICTRAGVALYNNPQGWDHTAFPHDYDDSVIFSDNVSFGVENPGMRDAPFFEVHYSETGGDTGRRDRFVVLNAFDFWF